MKRIVLGWLLFAAAAVAWALPSTQDVQQAVQRGDYTQAETMMREVVEARPGSANAHYVYAEILAHNGKFTLASDEARRAGEIDPQIKFTDAAKFRSFQQLLERQQHPAQTRTPAVSRGADPVAAAPLRSEVPGIPGWIWIAGIAVVGIGAWKLMSRNAARSNAMASGGAVAGYGGPAAAAPYGGAMAPNGPYGPGGGYGPGGFGPGMQQVPGAGGGLLRTGAAVAGGVAAGMLVDQFLHRNQDGGGAAHAAAAGTGGGMFDAVQPDTASAELENRQVDFGNDSWDAGSGDAGGGSSDDGGWN